ncbi:MAG: 3'-5' exonuclease [Victivallaceae bacterium]|nr:3'-5' exonuclease [Victivallaceae bacterium]
MNWFELGPFAVVDVETTGLRNDDRIVEIAAMRIDLDGSVTEFESLVNPLRHIPGCCVAVHHIDDSMVADAPAFYEVAPQFLEFCDGAKLVAHNATFDMRFIQHDLMRCGFPQLDVGILDTVKLLKGSHPGLSCYRLQFLRNYFNLKDREGDVAHRAGSDVYWEMQLLQISIERSLEVNGSKL